MTRRTDDIMNVCIASVKCARQSKCARARVRPSARVHVSEHADHTRTINPVLSGTLCQDWD